MKRCVHNVHVSAHKIILSLKDTNEDLSDDTEDTVAELGNSTDDSDTEADETDSLASSVAELSSGEDINYILFCEMNCLDCRNQPQTTVGRSVRKSTKKLLFDEISI